MQINLIARFASLFLAILLLSGIFSPAIAITQLSFDQLYGKISALGMEFSDKVKALKDQ